MFGIFRYGMGITKQLGICIRYLRNWYWMGYEIEKELLVRGRRERIRYTFLRETPRDRQVRELHSNGWIRAVVGLVWAGLEKGSGQ
jgi:hypothetical protein